jgi:hypothetical protein
MKKVLNVGGNNKGIALPSHFAGWQHILLDIDAKGNPDLVLDARELCGTTAAAYDAVYCSHNLEHYHRHDGARVIKGFNHVLKADGYAHIVVPDIGELMRIVAQNNLDIDDVLYQSAMGPITVRDVIYGYGAEIERSGSDFYAHKTGFTCKSLHLFLEQGGFPFVYVRADKLDIVALAFKKRPDEQAMRTFQLPAFAR